MCEPLVSVSTRCDMAAESVVGPAPSALGSLDLLVLVGLRCIDCRPKGQPLKVDPRKLDDSEGPFFCEWLLHVQSARDQHEQNLEIVAHEGRLYFRATREIKADEELLVWYGSEMSKALGVPTPTTFTFKGDGKYTCPLCGETFLYPFPCCAHVVYRCEQRRHLSSGITDIVQMSSTEEVAVPVKPQKLSSAYSIDFLSSSSVPSDSYRSTSPKDVNNSEITRVEDGTTPSKRKSDTNSSNPSKRREPPCKSRPSEKPEVQHQTDISAESNNHPLHPIDHNQNLGKTLTLRFDSGSAFKKVNKRTSESLSSSAVMPNQICGPTYSSADLAFASKTSIRPLYTMALPVVSASPPTLLPATSLPSAFVPTSKLLEVNDNVLGDSKIVMADGLRPPLYAEASQFRLPLTCVSYPPPKQFTPMEKFPVPPVASLLPPSLAALNFPAQNWCAKCNASFRMTSDLVYHMRSHHKREVDPAKKRRDEKLKCSICHESFRERHHLTRHMTSHQ